MLTGKLSPGLVFGGSLPGQPKNHYWVVIAEHTSGRCVIVNFTDIRNTETPEIVFHPGDAPFITKASTISLKDAKTPEIESLRLAINTRLIHEVNSRLPAGHVQRIREAALASPDFPHREFLQACH